MDTAELVQLMVNLVEDESFVIVSGVVLHYVVHCKRRNPCSELGWRDASALASGVTVPT